MSTPQPDSSPPKALENLAIVQLCFVTDDLEGSVATFARLTGLTPGPVSIAAEPGTPTTYRGGVAPVSARTQAFKLPNIDVEFLEPGPEPSTWRDMLTARGPALHHIAFRSGDLEVDSVALEEGGLTRLQHAGFVGGGGRYGVFDAEKTIGTMVELFQLQVRPE